MNEDLASQIAGIMGTQLSAINIGRYADGEITIQILENARGKDVLLEQPTPGINDDAPSFCALDYGGAVLLWSRVPISAAVVVVVVGLQYGQHQGFFVSETP